MDTRQHNVHEGDEVVTADGEKMGEVQKTLATYIVVEKGLLFPQDFYIPVSAISAHSEHRVVLSVTKDELMRQGWDTPPQVSDGIRQDDTLRGGFDTQAGAPGNDSGTPSQQE